MLFSVIVPVFDSEATLRPCIGSVLGQTYGGFELILVDDGSRDASLGICKEFAARDKRIQVLHQENRGPTAARNAGLRAARGSYILFLDSDDWFERDLLEACEREAEAAAPEMILFGHKAHFRGRAAPTNLARFRGRYGSGDRDAPLFHGLLMAEDGTALPRALWGKAFRKRLIRKWLPQTPPEIRTGEDMCCFIAAALEARTVSVLPGTYYNYRAVPGSLSRRGDPQALARCWYTMDFLDKLVPTDCEEMRKQLYRLAVQQMYSALLRAAWSRVSCGDMERDMERLSAHALCKEAVQKAEFSTAPYKVKKYLVKHKCVHAVKWIAMYRRGGRSLI